MAKKANSQPAKAGKLSGKSVAFVGKYGYKDMHRTKYEEMVKAAGATIVDPAKRAPDYLWVGDGRGGKPPGDVAKIQKQYPTVTAMTAGDFAAFLMPSRDEWIEQFKQLTSKDNYEYWDDFERQMVMSKKTMDFSSADLRKLDLGGAKLSRTNLDNADLRECKAEYATFGPLKGIDFRKAALKNVYLGALHECNFRDADLSHARFFYQGGHTAEKCDFKGCSMANSRMQRGTFRDCVFTGVDMPEAEGYQTIFERCDFSQAKLSQFQGKTAQFKECTFHKADLSRANLSGASMAGADLRNVDLTDAVLQDADLTGANLTGANLKNTILSGAKLDKVDLSKAKNYIAPVTHQAGPKVQELAAAAANATGFVTTARVDLGTKDEFALLTIEANQTRCWTRSQYERGDKSTNDYSTEATVENCLFKLAARWPKSTLRLDSITAKGSPSVRGKQLHELAVAAWAEAFGVATASPEQLAAARTKQAAGATAERDELLVKIRKQGTKAWNDLDSRAREQFDLRGVDLSKSKLDKIRLYQRDLVGTNFAGSSLQHAELWNAKLNRANLTGVNLSGGSLSDAVLNSADLTDADLTNAILRSAKLLGTNLTGATLKDTELDKAHFDHETKFPKGFKTPDSMVWKGAGARPMTKKESAKVVAKAAGSLEFAGFIAALNQKFDAARLHKAGSMLKKEKFQLFAEVEPDSLRGVVKSQTDKDLVYSCRLTSTGDFGCGTQNLKPCGGLQGALCKHLLVLIIGLAKAGELDAATVLHWINLSSRQKPQLDQDAASATFLKYKGAEAGELDWRPTETIPEDFYSM